MTIVFDNNADFRDMYYIVKYCLVSNYILFVKLYDTI